jgi:carbamoyltransferase
VIAVGIWDGHDSGAALVVDGRIVAAVNEERLSRRKLEVAFPARSIEACLRIGSIRPSDVQVVAASTSDVAKTIARVFPSTKERFYQVRRRRAGPGLLASATRRAKYWITELGPSAASRALSRVCLRRELTRVELDRARLDVHDHHWCHAVAAAAACGFPRALVLTIDGVGDGTSATVNVLENGRLRLLERTPARHSPGVFFEHVTHLLNMRELEDEGKVMALANYAPVPERNPLIGLLEADGLRFRTARPGHSLHHALRRLNWSFPNEQFARMAQDALERAVVLLVRRAVETTGIRVIALAGGVASNIQVNRRLRTLSTVDEVFVFPHMGDGGLALGAALASVFDVEPIREVDLQGLALGPEYGAREIRAILEREGLAFRETRCLAEDVAGRLAKGDVVMWFQGPMEYGPRALGQRSILARPDAPALRDRLNLILKRRVWYQPFCPSVLESEAGALFADWKGRPDRFMTMAYVVKEACIGKLAGVVGPDGTCRPQIVPDESSTDWAELLRRMRHHVGVGAVLNTSFNVHGEPLVCTPGEAIAVFRQSGADALACGPFVVERPV